MYAVTPRFAPASSPEQLEAAGALWQENPGSGYLNVHNARKPDRPVNVRLATDLGAGTSFSILQTLNETCKAAQLNGNALSAGHAFYMATLGTAKTLKTDDQAGNLDKGKEAGIVVLDMKSNPIVDCRMGYAKGIEERLFILMTMGGDRATRATYVAGELMYGRGEKTETGACATFSLGGQQALAAE